MTKMIELRFHGRGGQGVILSCEILAKALLKGGKYVQYSPDFSAERRGAPVRAFVRTDDKTIYLRQQIYEPDCVVVLDTSVGMDGVISGLKPGGWLVINSPDEPGEFNGLGSFKIATVDAREIALRHKIGNEAAPVVNTAVLGAVAKVMGFSLDSLIEAARDKFGDNQGNLSAIREGYEKVKVREK